MRISKFIFLSLIISSFAITSLMAQDSKLKLATVNMQQALNESVVGQKTKANIEAQVKSKTAEFKAREDKIVKLRGELDGGLLNADARKKKLNEIEDMQKNYIQDRQKTDEDFQKLEQDGTGKVFKDLKKIIADYAKKNGYDMVIEYSLYSALLYSNLNVTDITKQIIDAYNDSAK